MFQLSRREFVLGAGTTAALGLTGPLQFLSSAASAKAIEQGYLHYNVGDIACTAIYDGVWKKKHDDGFIRNASIDDTKKALAAAGMSTAYVPIPFAQTVLRTAGKTVLIDAGTGGQLAPTAGMTMKHLSAAGIDARKIDTVLISHFHPDHIFGLMTKGANEQIFPNAEIIVPAEEFKYWTDPSIVEALPKRRQGLARRIQATLPNWDNISQIDGERDVASGVRSIPAFGHTPGHTVYHVSSGDAQLFVMGDIANLPALFVRHPNWHAVFDGDPTMAEASRRRMFDRAISEGATIAGYHFGFPNAGTIAKDGAGYNFTPVES